MIGRRLHLHLAVFASLLGALALAAPAASLAGPSPPVGGETTTTGPGTPTTPSQTTSSTPGGEAQSTPTTSTPSQPAPTASSPEGQTTTTGEPSPQIETQHPQGTSASGSPAKTHAKSKTPSVPGTGAPTRGARAKQKAPSPSTLTPGLPFSLRSPFGGLSSFFIESFQIPPFLLPIFQAAGTAYGIPWQVLAAINEVETDYGRDLSISSAGAEGWMQFLPAEWAQYGVDANGDGFEDPYNPADAIFATARYLHAAGAGASIKAAVYSYNHSQAYVESVMLRARLLGGTPPELLGAITGLTEARFPVHAPSHFSDGFQSTAAGKALVGTTIYSQEGAPVIAVQDGEVVEVGDSPSLGHVVVLRDAYGNTYVYAQLGEVASVYPVLEPHVKSAVSARIDKAAHKEAVPAGPATAGAQPRSPLSEGATISGLALGAAAGLEPPPNPPAPAHPAPPSAPPAHAAGSFTEGPNQVYLHPLVPGVQVIAGTVLGHVGAGLPAASSSATGEGGAHIFFQIRPAGPGAPLIDPKPILDGWVALEETSIFHAKGENPFLATSPTVGQVLLESQQQLEPQVLGDQGVRLGRCAREDVQEGRVDKRVLAMLEYLAVSGLRPSVSGLPCAPATLAAAAANASAGATSDAVNITAINGTPIAGQRGPGSIVDEAVRKLLTLQGVSRPQRILSTIGYPGAAVAIDDPKASDIHVAYAALGGRVARTAVQSSSGLAPGEWLQLISRLGEIPDPTVASGHSSAAIPDPTTTTPSSQGGSSGNN
jgi:Transglycosylase SLT domain/Peptidase family M23